MFTRILLFLRKKILPLSKNEDEARREFILNILLVAIFALAFIVLVFKFVQYFAGWPTSTPFVAILIPVSFYIFLYILSRRGYFLISSFLFIAVFFLLASFMGYKFGIDLTMTLLIYVLIVIMAGILIHTRTAFWTAGAISIAFITINFLHRAHIIGVDRAWRTEKFWNPLEVIVFSIIFFIIATVSWLSNREIEKSLARARRSEAELKKERDSLEITVEARTRELKETQADKMTQLYRFAEFGRLSSGLFHDLINPLTAVSLNIEKVKNVEEVRAHVKSIEDKTGAAPISELSEYVDKAIVAAKKMEDMVNAVRKQLLRQENKTLFSLNIEIEQAIEVLSYKALKANVAISFFGNNKIKTYGDAVKFNQVALNLITNAIDAYQKSRGKDAREVIVSLDEKGDEIIFEVKDGGIGVSKENKPKLFEPFFTTKEEGYGIGIGLSMIKRIVEKDFSGSIEVVSKEEEGSVFTVKFPQKQNE